MKRMLGCLLALCMLVGVFAGAVCAEPEKKVAAISLLEDQFMKLQQMGFVAAAEDHGYTITVGNSNSDVAKEQELVRTYIEQGYPAIAISLVSGTASLQTLRDANEAGVALGITNHFLESEDYLAGCFSSSHYTLGQSTGKVAHDYIVENMDGKANVGIIQFMTLTAEGSSQRSGGFLDALADLEGVKVVADQDAWVQDDAITVVGDMLTAHPEIDLIWCANEGGTIGATMAVKNAGLAGKVVVFGTDASEQIVDLLKSDDNILQATTGQDAFSMGYQAMEAAILEVEGTNTTKGQCIEVPGILLERDKPEELDAYVENLKTLIG